MSRKKVELSGAKPLAKDADLLDQRGRLAREIAQFETGEHDEEYERLGIRERLALLDIHLPRHNGKPVSAYVREMFPELTALDPTEPHIALPQSAPALWKTDKRPGDTPAEFIARHYWQYLGNGLTRAHLRTLDYALYEALASWLKTHDLPAGIDLPTIEEQNDRLIRRLRRPIFERALRAMRLESPEEMRRLADVMIKRASKK